jgi:hypothetical protein
MSQEIKTFRSPGVHELIDEIEAHAKETNQKVVTISHETVNSVMGSEKRAIVVFESE